MKAKCSLIVVLAGILLLITGCSLIRSGSGPSQTEEPKCVGPTFDLWGTRNVLGPAEPFNAEARRAALGTESTTLDAIAQVAGWQGGWDRIIDVPDNTTAEELNRWAGAAGVCWEGLIVRDVWADESSEGVLLFMEGRKPVQVLWYAGSEKDFRIKRSSPVVNRYDILIPDRGKLEPAE
ncbi:hypothetical protein [Nocardia carnea]|uniref:hypothetical protein n=1 Tax=Nocardia carnea TaxID=37328 RepID=UPI002457FC4B|nr:hypothetical protein [Nocardia carnea]